MFKVPFSRSKIQISLALLLISGSISSCQQTLPPGQDSLSTSGTGAQQTLVRKPSPKSPVSAQKPTVSDISSAQKGKDTVGDLIAQIEEEAGTAILSETDEAALLAETDETDNVLIASLSTPAPTEPDDSRSTAALDAALNLLKRQTKPQTLPASSYRVPDKADEQLRVGVFLPLSGEFRQLGLDIAAGVDFAFFQTGLKNVELFYFDTAAGLQAAQAAEQAVDAEIDISVGPLFSTSTHIVGQILSTHNIPVLSLSNNLEAADAGRWVLGYLPEQQMDNLLAYAIEKNKTRIAILASQDDFGEKIRQHVKNRLSDFTIAPAKMMILDEETLNDEDLLKEQIKLFTGYIPPTDDDAQLPPALYDTVILAGDSNFILRTAPVLDYYDLGPSRATYLGTDLWSRAALVAEPSLQGALVTQAVLPDNQNFNNLWQTYFKSPPSHLSRLGFDVMAVIALTASQEKHKNPAGKKIDWRRSLLRDKGFSGFSGRFSLLPDGQNQRQYQLRQIRDGRLSSDLDNS